MGVGRAALRDVSVSHQHRLPSAKSPSLLCGGFSSRPVHLPGLPLVRGLDGTRMVCVKSCLSVPPPPLPGGGSDVCLGEIPRSRGRVGSQSVVRLFFFTLFRWKICFSPLSVTCSRYCGCRRIFFFFSAIASQNVVISVSTDFFSFVVNSSAP